MFTDEAVLTEPGPFSATATNLETGTSYEFRAVAQVGDTVVYGDILEFTKEPDDGEDGKNEKKKKREYERAKREYEKYNQECKNAS